MALPAPELDDRRFQDLVDETKRRITRHCPEWTNHNVADPGVALIELFAWMSELVLYRLNRVPERLYVKFLDLVGMRPFPPAAAQTELTFWLSAIVGERVTVPAGTAVSTVGRADEDVVFSTLDDLLIVQPTLAGAVTARAGDDERFDDAWDELRYDGGFVTCFTSEPITPGDTLHLGFERSLAGNVIRLDVEATIAGVGIDPDRPPLCWEVWSGEAWLPCRVHADTTGGLNRAGNIMLYVPLAHAPLTLGGNRAFWLRARLLASADGQPAYKASPELRTLRVVSLGGTVAAEHGEALGTEVLGISTGHPGQAFLVARPPALPRLDGEDVQVLTAQGSERWTEVADFTDSGPEDHHITWDSASGEIQFGPRVRQPDGTHRQHGAVPPEGAEVAVSAYRHGGGAEGNVGAETLVGMRTTIPFIDRVINPGEATGGVDGETIEELKTRGPLTLRTGQRAVTARDYERLALEASLEVARARCLAPERDGGPVRLLLVPHCRRRPDEQTIDDFALDDELTTRVGSYLEDRRVLGARVEIATPYYQGVTVAVLLRALPGRPVNLVRERALDVLHRFVNPLVGGPDGTGWPYDADLNAAALSALLEPIEGLERVEELLLFEYDLRNGTRHGQGRETLRLDQRSLFLSAQHQVVVR
ncbi:putative baseplate assembly protein [soil metagenome]